MKWDQKPLIGLEDLQSIEPGFSEGLGCYEAAYCQQRIGDGIPVSSNGRGGWSP